MFIVDEERKSSVLRRMIVKYAEDSITDEQVARVLAPVLARIRAGEFDQGKRKRRADRR